MLQTSERLAHGNRFLELIGQKSTTDNSDLLTALLEAGKSWATSTDGPLYEPTMVRNLPLLLRLEGKPYTLDNHFPMEPLFSTVLPQTTLLMCGRQVSKCMDPDTEITMADGEKRKASALKAGDSVLSVSGPNLFPGTVSQVWESGEKEALRLTFEDGSCLIVSPEHRVMTQAGWLPAGQLATGMIGYAVDRALTTGTVVDRLQDAIEAGRNRQLPPWLFSRGRIHLPVWISSFMRGRQRADLSDDEEILLNTAYRAIGCDTEGRRLAAEARRPVRLVSVEPVAARDMVDFEVTPCHNLVAGGVLVHNSTSLSAQALLKLGCIPYYTLLFVLPLFEMARRLSSNVMKPMILESPIRDYLIDRTCEQNVLQRSFRNGSKVLFSYASLDATRVRGIPADDLGVDEVQDLPWEHLPVIRATLDAAPDHMGFEQYSGTALGTDNTIEGLWQKSSQAEWAICCPHCKHENIPSTKFDALKMIATVDFLKLHGTGLQCAKCGKPVNARNGRWVHRLPKRASTFSGYHVPQIILPMHYESMEKWRKMQLKRDENPAAFMNETMGESYDSGAKLISLGDLNAAAMLPVHNENREECSRLFGKHRNTFIHKIMGIDWGGGGIDETSFTKVAIGGALPDGSIDFYYGVQLPSIYSDLEQAEHILNLATEFGVEFIAHDYAGAGSVQESMLISAGFPEDRIIPFSYCRLQSGDMIKLYANPHSDRYFYHLDKTRSLLISCSCIKFRYYRFPKEGADELLKDFLAIYKEIRETRTAGTVMTVNRQSLLSDDFVHAVNYAACGVSLLRGSLPNLAHIAKLAVPLITPEQEEELNPAWERQSMLTPENIPGVFLPKLLDGLPSESEGPSE